MNNDELQELYFQWLSHFVSRGFIANSAEEYFNSTSYNRLLRFLHETEFVYILGLDGNRYEDGIELRYRFGYENNIPDSLIACDLDICPCSILEMLVALALRCEEDIMYDPDLGNRTGLWFWNMIKNLGLLEMTDEHFDKETTQCIIERFLYREYRKDGQGGLVYIPNCTKDLRSVEIWYQMMWYLDEVRKESIQNTYIS